MKSVSIVMILAVAGLLLAQCTSSRSTHSGRPSMSSTEKVAEIKTKFTSEQIVQGKTLYELNCQRCHDLIPPAERTVFEFERVLPSMIQKARLSGEEGALVRAYLLSHAEMDS